MDQKKVGYFIKELRKEKGITQEQFAEILNISGRTVSRWETGNNMPDISLLVEISEFFEVSVTEIINGERKSEKMNEQVRETAEALSEYANTEKEMIIKDVRRLSLLGTGAIIIYYILDTTKLTLQNAAFETISFYCETLVYVTVLMILAHTTGLLSKIQRRNKNSSTVKKLETLPKAVQMIIAAVIAFVSALIIKLLFNSL